MELLGLNSDIADLLALDWSNQKVFVGVHFSHCEDIIEKMKQQKPDFIVWAVPELKCERWYRELEDENKFAALWSGLEHDNSLLDAENNAVGLFPFRVWLCSMKPK